MPCKPAAVLTTAAMAGIANMALPIPSLIRMEMVERLLPVIW